MDRTGPPADPRNVAGTRRAALVSPLHERAGMGEHASRADEMIEHVDSFWEPAHQTFETYAAYTEAAEKAAGHEGASMLGDVGAGIGLLGGMWNAGTGIHDLVTHPSVDAGLRTASGVNDIVGNGAELLGYGDLPGVNAISAGIDGLSAINDVRNGDYTSAVEHGASAALTYAAPEIAAPAKLGWTIGRAANAHADRIAAERNYLGDNRTVDDHANDAGQWVEDHTGGSRTLGALASSGVAIGDTAYVIGREGVEGLGHGIGRIGSAVSGLFGGDEGTIPLGPALAGAIPQLHAAAPARPHHDPLNPFSYYAD